jgi:hypothetical protein
MYLIMPWFIYNYPFPRNQSTSYTIVPENGVPECLNGEYLGAIFTETVPKSIPARPDINLPGLQKMIKLALKTKRPNGCVRLRSTP